MKKRPPKVWHVLAWMALGAFLLEESEPTPPALAKRATLEASHLAAVMRELAPPPTQAALTRAKPRQPAITVYDKPISWGGDYPGEWI